MIDRTFMVPPAMATMRRPLQGARAAGHDPLRSACSRPAPAMVEIVAEHLADPAERLDRVDLRPARSCPIPTRSRRGRSPMPTSIRSVSPAIGHRLGNALLAHQHGAVGEAVGRERDRHLTQSPPVRSASRLMTSCGLADRRGSTRPSGIQKRTCAAGVSAGRRRSPRACGRSRGPPASAPLARSRVRKCRPASPRAERQVVLVDVGHDLAALPRPNISASWSCQVDLARGRHDLLLGDVGGRNSSDDLALRHHARSGGRRSGIPRPRRSSRATASPRLAPSAKRRTPPDLAPISMPREGSSSITTSGWSPASCRSHLLLVAA